MASMASSRYWHTATLLLNGKVLVAGGYGSGTNFVLATAEVYDPASNTWSATHSLASPRVFHTATLLPNGKVLVSGGQDASGRSLETAEVYDPASGTWSATGSLVSPRGLHTATPLINGKVLISGGFYYSTLSTAELYTP
jgi:N-acetylneuraminic acid mutarotase